MIMKTLIDRKKNKQNWKFSSDKELQIVELYQ